MLAAPAVIVLTLASTTNLVLSCPPSSDITEIQDIRLCNGSLLSIKFNVSDSCSNIKANLLRYLYHHDTSGGATARSHVTWGYSHYSDVLCGVTATLKNPVIINVDEFDHANLLQIRLRDIFNGGNETCSNNFHVFLDDTGFLGPSVDINSNSYNCSTINVTWSDPDVNCGNEPLYYNLSIYDDITGSLVDTVSVYDTSYQFVDNNLFIHRYTYVITGVNELGEGISNNDTFSYQRVPRSVTGAGLRITAFNETSVTASFNIPVTLECTGEAPENATVTIQCNGTDIVYDDITEVEYAKQPMNITGSVPVPLYEQCTITVVFSNSAGSSEPFILTFGQNFCEQSKHIDEISDLESCNGTSKIISVIYRPPSEISNCSSIDDDYRVVIFHHDFQIPTNIMKHSSPERYNDTACLVRLTLSPDISDKENNNTLLQVWMMLSSKPPILYCSNNFTLQVDTDPPDPVNPQIHVGCNNVDVEWLAPFSPPGCPVRQYDIELNDEYFNITNTSLLHHSWPDLSPDMLNTLSISAVNDIGPSIQSNNTFITALNPQVMFLDYDVLIDDDNALLIINAEVNNSCTYSVPTHFYYNASCDANTVVSETRDVSNEQTSYQLPVPIDHLNCTTWLMWSNRNSSLPSTFYITFNTTQLLFIKLQPIDNGLNFTCHYRPNSSLWGCGILVKKSTKTISINETIGTITNLCPGEYNVAMFYVKDGMDYVIEYATVNISGTSCLLIILLPSLVGAIILIVTCILVVPFIFLIRRRQKNKNGGKKRESSVEQYPMAQLPSESPPPPPPPHVPSEFPPPPPHVPSESPPPPPRAPSEFPYPSPVPSESPHPSPVPSESPHPSPVPSATEPSTPLTKPSANEKVKKPDIKDQEDSKQELPSIVKDEKGTLHPVEESDQSYKPTLERKEHINNKIDVVAAGSSNKEEFRIDESLTAEATYTAITEETFTNGSEDDGSFLGYMYNQPHPSSAPPHDDAPATGKDKTSPKKSDAQAAPVSGFEFKEISERIKFFDDQNK